MKITHRQLRRIIKEELHSAGTLTEAMTRMTSGCMRRGIQVGNQNIVVEIADTDFLRRRGLMFRKNMPVNEGMLFIFSEARKQSFWMKNTDIPLSIAFINPSGAITSIQDMESNSLNEASSDCPVLYALEMNHGWFRENNIMTGDRIVF